MFINEYGDKNNPLFLLLSGKELPRLPQYHIRSGGYHRAFLSGQQLR